MSMEASLRASPLSTPLSSHVLRRGLCRQSERSTSLVKMIATVSGRGGLKTRAKATARAQARLMPIFAVLRRVPGWSSDSAGMCTQWKQERTSEPTTYALRFTEMGGRWECNVACRMSRPSRSQSSTSARRSCLGAICAAQIAGAGARTWVEASRAHLCSPVRRLRCRSIRAACKVTSWPVS